MRRMAFSATIPQMRDRTKTVTRRAETTWEKHADPGDKLLAIEQGMGLPKGQKQVILHPILIVANRLENFVQGLTTEEVALEGFPGKSPDWFFENVWRPMHGSLPSPKAVVRRIEFAHLEDGTEGDE